MRRGYRTGPAKSRRGFLLLLIFLLPLLISITSFFFPAAEVIEHYNELDKERKQELNEDGSIKYTPKSTSPHGRK